MTVKELIQLLSTWSESDEEVLVEVNHGDLRDIVIRRVTKEKLNSQGTIVCDEEEKGRNVVVISV
tara:strand:+ start:88 stop:282 length:195 start_codon:yes stop_codon:yes gene_type:complete